MPKFSLLNSKHPGALEIEFNSQNPDSLLDFRDHPPPSALVQSTWTRSYFAGSGEGSCVCLTHQTAALTHGSQDDIVLPRFLKPLQFQLLY